MSIDQQLFKNVLARWTSGVTILTTVYNEKWKGTTVSSFTSISLEPPLILVSLAHKLYTHQVVKSSGVFAVSILHHQQAELGKLFAGMYPHIDDRFATHDWFTAVTGSPILSNALGWVDCRTVQEITAGDHTIFLGEVVDANTSELHPPLLYHNRKWGQFAELTSD